MLTLSSCLVDDPPPFPESKQTPPRLDNHNALPHPSDLIFASSGQTLHFTIPVASEDAGDELAARMFVDYKGGQGVAIGPGSSVRPSTLDDTTRSILIDWSVTQAAGCHRLTLRVTHSRNIDTSNYPEVHDASDLAEAYWWAVIDADPSVGMVDCPGPLGGTP